MNVVARRAREAIDAANARGARGARGPRPRGKYAGIALFYRMDPALVLSVHELTGRTPDQHELVLALTRILNAARSGATDAELAFSVRAMLSSGEAA